LQKQPARSPSAKPGVPPCAPHSGATASTAISSKAKLSTLRNSIIDTFKHIAQYPSHDEWCEALPIQDERKTKATAMKRA
jgi:hypothetical protein